MFPEGLTWISPESVLPVIEVAGPALSHCKLLGSEFSKHPVAGAFRFDVFFADSCHDKAEFALICDLYRERFPALFADVLNAFLRAEAQYAVRLRLERDAWFGAVDAALLFQLVFG